jgi:hypothetical protein
MQPICGLDIIQKYNNIITLNNNNKKQLFLSASQIGIKNGYFELYYNSIVYLLLLKICQW